MRKNTKMTNTEIVPADESKVKNVADEVALYLGKADVRKQLMMALPKHLTPDRLMRIALTTIRTTPKLLECTMPSLIASIMQAAQLGLEPGLLGHCYLVPFNKNVAPKGQKPQWIKEAQFMIGYRGLIDLSRRKGEIVTIAAETVYTNDQFTYVKGFEERLEHIPAWTNRGELLLYYAYATTKDGGRYATVMNVAEVEKIRQRSKSKDDGPWITDPEEMGKKTVLRRLCKYLPLAVEILTEIRKDELLEFGNLRLGERDSGLPSIEHKASTEDLNAEIAALEAEKPLDQGGTRTAVQEQLPDWDAIDAAAKEKIRLEALK